MHHGFHPLFAVLLVALLGSWGFAQLGPEVVTTYQLAQLERQPGKLLVSPGYLTIVDFPEVISSVSSGRSSLVRSEVQGSRLLLTATAGTGRTDLVVSSGAHTALFVVVLSTDSSAPRRYRVSDEPEPVATTKPAPKPPMAPPVKTTPVRAINPREPVPVLRASTESRGVRFEVELASWSDAGGVLALRYTLENRSGKPVLIDPALLETIADGRSVPYRLARTPNPPSRFLPPGETEHGLVLVERPLRSSLTLRWPVVETARARRTTLEVNFDVRSTVNP